MNPRVLKIGRNILFMLSVPAIIFAFVFADVTTRHEVCRGVQISFLNNQLSFVTKQNINEILEANGVTANKTRLSNLHINQLEKAIEENKWVKNADIFVSADSRIHIRIAQKIPVVRIQPENDFEEPYYLDEFGNNILYSTQYIPDLPVVTSPTIGYNSADLDFKSDIVKLAKYLTADTFWSAAITQIAVDENKLISLIPAFGTQHIILGNVNDLENKMSKLFQFYKQGYHTVRWDKYDEIDLRFERQVVCRNTRGERISVDPYDKSTHQEILAVKETLPVQAAATALASKVVPATAKDINPNVSVPKPQPVPVKSAPAVIKTVTAAAKPITPASTPKAAEKKTVVKADKAVAKAEPKDAAHSKPVAKESRPVTKESKPVAKESKPVMTEVQNSKYFKQ
ncbi:MAG: hypothetical protein IT257_00780 [Chitinophagaceae bacterium]|nr:hypothetical protein [Chitinophagaceae bacterium]